MLAHGTRVPSRSRNSRRRGSCRPAGCAHRTGAAPAADGRDHRSARTEPAVGAPAGEVAHHREPARSRSHRFDPAAAGIDRGSLRNRGGLAPDGRQHLAIVAEARIQAAVRPVAGEREDASGVGRAADDDPPVLLDEHAIRRRGVTPDVGRDDPALAEARIESSGRGLGERANASVATTVAANHIFMESPRPSSGRVRTGSGRSTSERKRRTAGKRLGQT